MPSEYETHLQSDPDGPVELSEHERNLQLLSVWDSRAAVRRDANHNVRLVHLEASQHLAHQDARLVSHLSLILGLIMTLSTIFVGYRAWSFIPENVTITLLLSLGLVLGLVVIGIGQVYSVAIRNSMRAQKMVADAKFKADAEIEQADSELREVESYLRKPAENAPSVGQSRRTVVRYKKRIPPARIYVDANRRGSGLWQSGSVRKFSGGRNPNG